MSKIIYKYPVTSGKCVIRMPYRAQVLTIDYDPNSVLCLWAIHDPDDEKDRWVEHEVLVLPTGMQTDEPLAVLGEDSTDAFSYMKTIITDAFVWHIFTRLVYHTDT